MKKKYIYPLSILSLISFFSFIIKVFWDEIVNVYAVVGWWNVTPRVLSVNPNFDPVVIKRNSLQNFSLQLSDPDSNSITYTITPSNWSVSPTSGTITDPINLQAWQSFLNFSYISPNAKVTNGTITITLNDWSWDVVTKTINLYVY